MEKTEKKAVKKVTKKTTTKASAPKKVVEVVNTENKKALKVEKPTIKKVVEVKKPVVKAPLVKAKIDKTKFAVVLINNQQEKVHEGEKLVVDLQHEDKLVFDKVLLYVNGETVTFGTPYIEGAKVTAKRTDDFKDKKIRVSTFKAKSRYRKVIGHRQQKSNILVESINIK